MKKLGVIRGIVGALMLGVLTVGCALPKPTALDASPTEAIVVGKFQIRYNGKDVTDGAAVLFDEHVWGTSAVSLGADGWMIAKLPLGAHHVDRIAFAKFPSGHFHYDFPPGQVGFNAVKGGSVYYIGHVDIDWNGQSFKVSQLFGAVGAIADQMANDGTAVLKVTDNSTDARQMLVQKFSQDVLVEKALLPSISPDATTVALGTASR